MNGQFQRCRRKGRLYLRRIRVMGAGAGGMLVCWLLLLWVFQAVVR